MLRVTSAKRLQRRSPSLSSPSYKSTTSWSTSSWSAFSAILSSCYHDTNPQHHMSIQGVGSVTGQICPLYFHGMGQSQTQQVVTGKMKKKKNTIKESLLFWPNKAFAVWSIHFDTGTTPVMNTARSWIHSHPQGKTVILILTAPLTFIFKEK